MGRNMYVSQKKKKLACSPKNAQMLPSTSNSIRPLKNSQNLACENGLSLMVSAVVPEDIQVFNLLVLASIHHSIGTLLESTKVKTETLYTLSKRRLQL